ncbi:MAG: hypothetical protein WCK67_13250 [bacterium]
MNNINRFNFANNQISCQPLREKHANKTTAFKSENNCTNSISSVDDKNVEKFGEKFYAACNEFKGLFPYLTAKESAALIWGSMKSNKNKNSEIDYEI